MSSAIRPCSIADLPVIQGKKSGKDWGRVYIFHFFVANCRRNPRFFEPVIAGIIPELSFPRKRESRLFLFQCFGLIVTFILIERVKPKALFSTNTRSYVPMNPGPGIQENMPVRASSVEPTGRGRSWSPTTR